MTPKRIALVSCLGVLAIAGVCLGVVAFAVASFFSDMCGNKVLEEVPSPGARYKAVAFERDCGATTGFSTQVSILSADEGDPEDAGNAFQANTDRGAAPSGPGGGPKVSLEWVADETLVITYDSRARVGKPESYLEGVNIEYRAVSGEETTSSRAPPE